MMLEYYREGNNLVELNIETGDKLQWIDHFLYPERETPALRTE